MVSYPVHKVLTNKSGKFAFSAKYSSEKVAAYLIECRILSRTINDLPILPKIYSQIEEDLIKRAIFSTAAIEGNPLSADKVSEILSNPKHIQSKEKAQTEINNLKNAYEFIKNITPPDSFLTINEKLLREIHKAVTKDIDYNDNIPGNFRNHIVKVGDKSHGGVYTPPKIIEDINVLASFFIQWINNKNILNLDPIIRAALAHYHLSLIHPFADGNGRTARLIEALILQASGIKYVPVMLSNFYYRNLDDYYRAFSAAIKNKENDISSFLEFVLLGMVESLKEIKEIITYHITVLTLKD
jgi:Fic family protein